MSRYVGRLSVAGSLLFFAMAVNVFSAGGNLDPTFNGTGKTVFNIEDAATFGHLTDIAVLPGGKFLVVGSATIASDYQAIALKRFNSDGSLDTSFGAGGVMLTDVGVTAAGTAVALQPDGKIVVVGNAGNYPDLVSVVLRYAPDGLLDTTFGMNGVFTNGVMKVATEVRILADNKIVIGGMSHIPNLGRTQVTKLTSNGSLDTTFGTNGVTSSTYDLAFATDTMVVQPDGKIVVSGADYLKSWVVHRFNPDGSPDLTFATMGVRQISLGTALYDGGLVLQPDGKIVMSGSKVVSGGVSNTSLVLVRLNTDGSTDDTFGGGFIEHDFSIRGDGAKDLVLQSDGKFVVAGFYDGPQAAIIRLTSTGGMDTTFDQDGIRPLPPGTLALSVALQGENIVTTGLLAGNGLFIAIVDSSGTVLTNRSETFTSGKNDQAQDVAIQSDGKIVTAGSSYLPDGRPAVSVARLLPNGTLDTSFGAGGKIILNALPSASEAFALEVQWDGKIVVAGRQWTFGSLSSYTLFVVRLNPNGSLDTGFGSGGRVIIDLNGEQVGYDLELQPDGKIVIGGSSFRPIGDGIYNYDLLAARLNTNGTPDTRFGTNGVYIHVTGTPGSGQHEQAYAVSVLPTGQILLAGTHLLRLEANGTVDTTFSATPVPLDFPATDIRLQADGKMLLAGSSNSDLAVNRRLANGSVDSGFGIGGTARLDFGGHDIANDIYIDVNGNIFAGGSTQGGTPFRRRFAVGRFKSDGSPDPTFGSGGKVITDFGGDAAAYGIARQSDGKIVAAGEAKLGVDRDYAVARYLTNSAPFDFDGDGKTDIGIYRPGAGEWWYQRSIDGQVPAFQFGASTDKIAPVDFTGDGKADVAFWRPQTGQWFVIRSEDFSFYAFPFGIAGDIPVPADYDADGRADAAVFRPSSATWFISQSGGGATRIFQFGVTGDLPVVSDYDGDGRADVGIFRPGPGEWWINRSTNGLLAMQFGNSTDKPVQADYTGDGKTDVAVWRPSTGEWFIVRSEDSSFYGFPFGTNGDAPAPGDYDGDGKFDPTVFRPSSATWFIGRTTAGTQIVQFGVNGDRPIPNAFVP